MSKPFIHDDFLLQNDFARELYHDHAARMPIIDYHCHLSPQEVAEDKSWQTMTEVWLGGDHYKWRQMRTNGIDEKYITGDADDWEKFRKWAATMPYLLRNPLYHWNQLELKRYFGIDDLLTPQTARAIYDRCNEQLATDQFSARRLMERSDVKLVCTTDDPIDSLEYHQAIAADENFDVQVLPTWRPDKGMAVDKPQQFNAWIDKLAEVADLDISDFDSYMEAIRKRHDFFHSVGCRLSDHGVETVYQIDYTQAEIKTIFGKVRGGSELTGEEIDKFRSAMLYEFGLMDAEKNWTQQIHYGAIRNNNTKMFEKLGPDTGFDSIGDFPVAKPLSKLLDRLAMAGKLPKTILYNLNPSDNEVLGTMLGNFQDGTVPGKIQHGSGWWFLDHIDGMRRQMESLSALGLLSRFVGMLTDSRSFLSYTRHEYFRRILCNMLADDLAAGLIPDDMELVGRMVRDISYNNAARYFGFDLPDLG
ncbi:MAG: glucuronate isomerase [Phycisphaerae bacterium]